MLSQSPFAGEAQPLVNTIGWAADPLAMSVPLMVRRPSPRLIPLTITVTPGETVSLTSKATVVPPASVQSAVQDVLTMMIVLEPGHSASGASGSVAPMTVMLARTNNNGNNIRLGL